MTVVWFLLLTFAISLSGYACIRAIPAARSPDSAVGLPFWLLMVWGPSLAAFILSIQAGQLGPLLRRGLIVSTVPPFVWALICAPLVLLLLMKVMAPARPRPLSLAALAGLTLFNLILGPLGEEFGWRGLMQDELALRWGWLLAALVTGVIWLVWHLPLWTIDSPHAQISLPLFAGHVMVYSIIIGAAHRLSGGSLLPAILIHLTVNLAANLAIYAGYPEPNDWFRKSLLPYLGLAIFAAVWVGSLA
jgi:uncharacterized protein